jgi:hypothetical protein
MTRGSDLAGDGALIWREKLTRLNNYFTWQWQLVAVTSWRLLVVGFDSTFGVAMATSDCMALDRSR